MQVIKRDYKLSSYSLNSVSAHFLGQQKEVCMREIPNAVKEPCIDHQHSGCFVHRTYIGRSLPICSKALLMIAVVSPSTVSRMQHCHSGCSIS